MFYPLFHVFLKDFDPSFYYPQLLFIFFLLSINDHQSFKSNFIRIILLYILLVKSNSLVNVIVFFSLFGYFISLVNLQSDLVVSCHSATTFFIKGSMKLNLNWTPAAHLL